MDENCVTYAASRFEKHGFEKKNRHSYHFEKKNYQKNFLCTLRYVQ